MSETEQAQPQSPVVGNSPCDPGDPRPLVEALKRKAMLEAASQLHDEMRKLKPEDRGRDNLTFLQRPYARSMARKAVGKASVWYTAYMPSLLGRVNGEGEMTRPLRTLGDRALWESFRDLGIEGLHTGPVMRSGGFITADDVVADQKYTTIDGWFDPIELGIEEQLGSEEDYRQLVDVAREMGPLRAGVNGLTPTPAIVIGDVVPGHTGMGADFHLALQGAEHYPGLFVLVRVDRILDREDERHQALPADVIESLCGLEPAPGEISRLLSEREVRALATAQIIPGTLQRSMGAQAGEGWSITRPICGVSDNLTGITDPASAVRVSRRWVYLHFFHPKQPTLNWFDPGYAAWRMMNGQINYMIWKLGSHAVRLDANAFLGIERRLHEVMIGEVASPRHEEEPDTWSEAHPLSEMVSNMLAWQSRRLDGFSFQEMNMSIPDVARTQELGPDLAYDFMTRPACEHAVLTGNADLLRMMYSEMNRYGVDPISLIHALQNHDEFTYELVHLTTRDKTADSGRDDRLHGYGGMRSFCKDDELKDEDNRREARDGAMGEASFESIWGRVRREMREAALSNPYNRESPNGLCTTMAGMMAAKLGIQDLASLTAPPAGQHESDEARNTRLQTRDSIKAGHLLLAAFNALQPGVFALSGWDLVGALPIKEEQVPFELVHAGSTRKPPAERDYRWVNRGCYKIISDFCGQGLQQRETHEVYGPLSLPEAPCLYGPVDLQAEDENSFFRRLKAILSARRELSLATGEFGGTLDLGKPELFGSWTWLSGEENLRGTAALAAFNFSREPQEVRLDLSSEAIWLTRWSRPESKSARQTETTRQRIVRRADIYDALPGPQEGKEPAYRKAPISWDASKEEELFTFTIEPWGVRLFHLYPASAS